MERQTGAPFERATFPALLSAVLAEAGLECFAEAAMLEKFTLLTERLLERNRAVNLTAIVEPAEICRRHYADCLRISDYLPRGARVLDLGCGGGFPTLPLAIGRGDLRITAMDGRGKKLAFVRECAEALGLTGVEILPARAEEAGRKAEYRGRYDRVTARAVAESGRLVKWAMPFLRPGGELLAMKGPGGKDEAAALEAALPKMGARLAEMVSYRLCGMERTLLRFEKI